MATVVIATGEVAFQSHLHGYLSEHRKEYYFMKYSFLDIVLCFRMETQMEGITEDIARLQLL